MWPPTSRLPWGLKGSLSSVPLCSVWAPGKAEAAPVTSGHLPTSRGPPLAPALCWTLGGGGAAGETPHRCAGNATKYINETDGRPKPLGVCNEQGFHQAPGNEESEFRGLLGDRAPLEGGPRQAPRPAEETVLSTSSWETSENVPTS